MRGLSAGILMLLLTVNLSAQSVTVSQSKLDVLTQILTEYETIVPELQALSTDLKQRTSSLESGFDQYKKTVDETLVPKALKLEADVKQLKLFNTILGWGLMSTIVAVIVETAIILLK